MTMKISHGTRIAAIGSWNGYGYATTNMLASLDRLGYETTQNDRTADVEIWFDQPHHWKFSDGPYKIGYHPWESTRLKKGWVDIMNQCDEIWTPSPIIAEWYRDDGVTVPVYTYEHGVDKVWSPKKRKVEDEFKFLHVGLDAARKGGQEVMSAFREAFPTRTDVSLTMKMINSGFNLPKIGRINILNEKLTVEELVSVFHDHHAFVYPSYGEGFGLNPLQAMSTGMPTITVPAWAPYARFLDPNLNIDSKLLYSPWRRTHHPGKMFKPTYDDIIDKMRWAVDNYDEAHANAIDKVDEIQAAYDWDTITATTFGDLEKRLGYS